MHRYLILLLSIALVAAFYISGVVFREAEDVTGSIEEFHDSVSPFSVLTPRLIQFGIWLAVVLVAGWLGFHWLPVAWQRFHAA